MPFRQYCSLPPRQLAHSRQELTMQPTPTRSPTRWSVTSAPTSATTPTISCPGTTGKGCGPQSPLTVWMSEWQMPAYSIRISTSLAPTSRRSIVVGASGSPAEGAAYAFTRIWGCSFVWARPTRGPRGSVERGTGWLLLLGSLELVGECTCLHRQQVAARGVPGLDRLPVV